MYVFAILLAVGGSIVYHLSIKQVPSGVNPFFSLAVSYGTALLVCLAGMGAVSGSRSLGELGWSSAGVALGILGIELGFLLAYRSGWHLGTASLSSNLLSTALLLPVGVLLFGEALSGARVAGVLFSGVGLWLMMQK